MLSGGELDEMLARTLSRMTWTDMIAVLPQCC